MTIEIRHCDTGVVLHTVNAETLRGADLTDADLRGAYLIGANLSEAYLDGADLRGAYLTGANLRGAYLDEAELRGAYLTGADLTEATMGEDKLSHLLARATRLDGYEFFLFALQDGSTKIKAGCCWMTLADYRDHVVEEYPDTDKVRETLDILNFFEARAR